MPSPSFSQNTENVFVIDLDQTSMEDIVEKKLLYFLKQPSCLKTNLLKQFYEPAEQALIELCLKKQKGNRLKTAKLLGINRNTLKIKLIHYKLDVKKLWFKEKESCLEDKIFLSLLPSLDLLTACRAKLARSQNLIPESNVLKTLCQPVEKRIIQRVFEHCGKNQIQSSRFLGINRNTLKKKMRLRPKVRVRACS